ncbi:hypothetical protein [Haliscomenobacter sp.]|uniref:hypothetical protein n=1 Tax=Haliscomenobacter sp. TaxID=2717303 RepID=UPI00359396AA
MKEILDEDFGEKAKGDFYAKLSFGAAMLTLFLLGYLWVTRPLRMNACFGISHHMLALNIIQFSTLFGFIFGLISMIKKENSKTMERVGIGLNFAFVFFILCLIIARQIIAF